MSDTTRLSLPLLAAAQAQKHVTVNEALSRIDALTQLIMLEVDRNSPPAVPAEGDAYGVGPAPVSAWEGQAGKIALFVNGGWVFAPVHLGMRAYVVAWNGWAGFDGEVWAEGLQSLAPSGAGMQMRVREIDHVIGQGATSSVFYALPDQAVVFGITGRVLADITGTLSGFSLGVASSANRYGSGLSLATGSWLRGLTGTPVTYYAPESLVLTAENGEFTGGTVRLDIHYAQFSLPRA